MDLDLLVTTINEGRSATIRLHLVSGNTLDLPPGTKAFLETGVDTLLILWGSDGHRVARSRYVSGVNIESIEQIAKSAA